MDGWMDGVGSGWITPDAKANRDVRAKHFEAPS